MRRAIIAWICLLSAMAWATAGDLFFQLPFETILPWALDRGRWEIGTGLLYRAHVHPPFFAQDPAARRNEWRCSLVDATLGLGGGGEVQVQLGLQRFEEDGGLGETGIQDARVSFTYELPPQKLASALRFGVKLPNASNVRRLGTDETDIFLLGSLGHFESRRGWAADAGLGILGSPLDAGAQDDVLVFGLAGWLSVGERESSHGRFFLLAEVNGYAASRLGNDFRVARAGALFFAGALPISVVARRGLTSESEEWGLEAMLVLSHPLLRH